MLLKYDLAHIEFMIKANVSDVKLCIILVRIEYQDLCNVPFL